MVWRGRWWWTTFLDAFCCRGGPQLWVDWGGAIHLLPGVGISDNARWLLTVPPVDACHLCVRRRVWVDRAVGSHPPGGAAGCGVAQWPLVVPKVGACCCCVGRLVLVACAACNRLPAGAASCGVTVQLEGHNLFWHLVLLRRAVAVGGFGWGHPPAGGCCHLWRPRLAAGGHPRVVLAPSCALTGEAVLVQWPPHGG